MSWSSVGYHRDRRDACGGALTRAFLSAESCSELCLNNLTNGRCLQIRRELNRKDTDYRHGS
jgi:hypothetical protein